MVIVWDLTWLILFNVILKTRILHVSTSVLESSVSADLSLILWSDGHTHPLIFPSCISENWSLFWFVFFFSVLFIACHLNDKKKLHFLIFCFLYKNSTSLCLSQSRIFHPSTFAFLMRKLQIVQLFHCSCMRDLSESCAYMHALEGMIQNAQENNLQKASHSYFILIVPV